MSDFDDSFWYKPKRPRREIVEDAMSRLQIERPAEAPRHVGPMEMTDEERAAFQARGMRLWAADFVEVVGSPYPMTKTLARQLGYDVDRLEQAAAGVDPEITAE